MTIRENTPIRRTRVVAPSGEVQTNDMEIGQGPARVMHSTGDASESLSSGTIELTNEPIDSERIAMLAFFEEPVTIRIAETTDPNAAPVFEITVNGRTELFKRGETKTVKRYFVDRMLRLKQTRFEQRDATASDGSKDIVYDPRTSLLYDFAIVRDTNPVGESWHKHVLAEQG